MEEGTSSRVYMWLVGSYSSTCVAVHCSSGHFGHVGPHPLIKAISLYAIIRVYMYGRW